ncbi:uncharacterized protein LOC128882840 [Hylaeus volcanicus]|uniref:uncharacterized protein LOC128882840 n=1 Tax=Hylaeus volcanicus TaxID=313075 RepID=UPI0023B7A12D|nr:uncharacterized protein LOC128882840 [Hylaeus volcanicus]
MSTVHQISHPKKSQCVTTEKKKFHNFTIWETVAAYAFVLSFYAYFYIIINQYLLCTTSLFMMGVCLNTLYCRKQNSFLFILFSSLYVLAILIYAYAELYFYSNSILGESQLRSPITSKESIIYLPHGGELFTNFFSSLLLIHMMIVTLFVIHIILFLYNSYSESIKTFFWLQPPTFQPNTTFSYYTINRRITFWQLFMGFLSIFLFCSVIYMSVLALLMTIVLLALFFIGLLIWNYAKPYPYLYIHEGQATPNASFSKHISYALKHLPYFRNFQPCGVYITNLPCSIPTKRHGVSRLPHFSYFSSDDPRFNQLRGTKQGLSSSKRHKPQDAKKQCVFTFILITSYVVLTFLSVVLVTLHLSKLEKDFSFSNSWGIMKQSPLVQSAKNHLNDKVAPRSPVFLSPFQNQTHLDQMNSAALSMMKNQSKEKTGIDSFVLANSLVLFHSKNVAAAAGLLSIVVEISVVFFFLFSLAMAIWVITERKLFNQFFQTCIIIQRRRKIALSVETPQEATPVSDPDVMKSRPIVEHPKPSAYTNRFHKNDIRDNDKQKAISMESQSQEQTNFWGTDSLGTQDAKDSVISEKTVVITIDSDTGLFSPNDFLEVAPDDHIVTTGTEGPVTMMSSDDFNIKRFSSTLMDRHYIKNIVNVPTDIAYIPREHSLENMFDLTMGHNKANLHENMHSRQVPKPTQSKFPSMFPQGTYLFPKMSIWTPRSHEKPRF